MDYGQPLERLPRLMTPPQERLDVRTALTGGKLLVAQAARQIQRRVDIGMAGEGADRTAKRLLCGSVRATGIVTARTLTASEYALFTRVARRPLRFASQASCAGMWPRWEA